MSESTDAALEKAPEVKDAVPTATEDSNANGHSTEAEESIDSAAPAGKVDNKPVETTTDAKKPYDHLLAGLGSILKEADHDEVYGLKVNTSGDLHTSIILQVLLVINSS